ncbi:hypothetical protein PHSY_000586 [Pseudozyma hubeiensis SY62]|uniref:Uncharacterized protein n=1 Tax=Pseudozyma hubeiensis (strain SY62) TaxID=1305764 RepID=R9P4J3_PSEHS|nr:hypothetical protein PHSY_000586 [Pseudozyma hubeiensis SY62]GAC93025.1 hypothetical protein PHSY_000586 [Pseudozyma hubeiensis SY62]
MCFAEAAVQRSSSPSLLNTTKTRQLTASKREEHRINEQKLHRDIVKRHVFVIRTKLTITCDCWQTWRKYSILP